MEAQMITQFKDLIQDIYTFLQDINRIDLPASLQKEATSLCNKLSKIKIKGDSLQKEVSKKPKLPPLPTNPQNSAGSFEDDDGSSFDNVSEETEEIYDSLDEEPKPSKSSESSRQTPQRTKQDNQIKRARNSSSKKSQKNIPNISAESLMESAHKGFLQKKSPHRVIGHYQSRFCVIYEGVFYYFENEKSKKPCGAFDISDYEARTAYHLFKEQEKKERSFELVSPGKRTYKFLADDFDTMVKWIHAFAQYSDVQHTLEIEKPSEATGVVVDSQDNNPDAKVAAHRKESLIKHRPLPLPKTPDEVSDTSQELYADAEDDLCHNDMESQLCYDDGAAVRQDVYDDGVASEQEPYDYGAAVKQEVYDDGTTDKQDVYDDGATEKQDVYDDGAIENQDVYDDGETEQQEVYDDGSAGKQGSKKAKTLGKQVKAPLTLTRSKPLPPTPKVQHTLAVDRTDYSNMYYGLWNCDGSKPHELSFKRGEIIQIIERKYEGAGWLTGVLNDKVGLVPKNFLAPAYTKA